MSSVTVIATALDKDEHINPPLNPGTFYRIIEGLRKDTIMFAGHNKVVNYLTLQVRPYCGYDYYETVAMKYKFEVFKGLLKID